MSVQILCGDSLTLLKTLPDASVHCCITSPPYYGLRDYGVEGQLGLEKTPEEYVAKLVAVFQEVKRVLRDDGTLWLNLGDSYNGAAANRTGDNVFDDGRNNRDKRFSAGGCPNLKSKDLIGIPWRVAFALQADGWYLRQDIIWAKPNPMPESVRDRCTKAHEYVFMLSKKERYYYDAGAIKEERTSEQEGHTFGGNKYTPESCGKHSVGSKYTSDGSRNKRSVWTVCTQPFKEAHFATFPPELVKPMILSGCPESGTVIDTFAGSGTTGMVAENLGRNSILIELSQKYIDLIKVRTAQVGMQMTPTQKNLEQQKY